MTTHLVFFFFHGASEPAPPEVPAPVPFPPVVTGVWRPRLEAAKPAPATGTWRPEAR